MIEKIFKKENIFLSIFTILPFIYGLSLDFSVFLVTAIFLIEILQMYLKNKKLNITVNIKKNKTTGATIKKLKGNKKYYIRIRTYKTVKVNGKNVKLYSGWSKPKNVTTKK